jgi:hypothetical protein
LLELRFSICRHWHCCCWGCNSRSNFSAWQMRNGCYIKPFRNMESTWHERPVWCRACTRVSFVSNVFYLRLQFSRPTEKKWVRVTFAPRRRRNGCIDDTQAQVTVSDSIALAMISVARGPNLGSKALRLTPRNRPKVSLCLPVPPIFACHRHLRNSRIPSSLLR